MPYIPIYDIHTTYQDGKNMLHINLLEYVVDEKRVPHLRIGIENVSDSIGKWKFHRSLRKDIKVSIIYEP